MFVDPEQMLALGAVGSQNMSSRGWYKVLC